MIQQIKSLDTCSSACLSGQALVLINKRWILSIALVILGLCNTFIHATVLSVALDGSQPYNSIQTAINASAHGDTVLVYPGRYYENVTFNGRNITLASLELITGNRDYMHSTVIDGNQNGSVIRCSNAESSISIRGFTITNGSGEINPTSGSYNGGGIVLYNMSGQRDVFLTNCIIKDNRATNGGGFWGGACNLSLSGVTITGNFASRGGGLHFDGSEIYGYNTTYNPANRCNIHSNFAANGSDLYYTNLDSIHVIVDTMTVANPWNFYATAIPRSPNIECPYTFDILNTVHEEVNHDLYVAPWGDDSNSGLSPAEPMRTIFKAMYSIASDSDNPKAVHVSHGCYSTSLNGQLFPIPVKSHTRLIGESVDGTILDAENHSIVLSISANSQNFRVQSVTLENGFTGIATPYAMDYQIKNTKIRNLSAIQSSRGIGSYGARGELLIKNVVIENIDSTTIRGVDAGWLSGNMIIKDTEMSGFNTIGQLTAIEISTRNESEVVFEGCNIHDINSLSADEFSFNSLFQISPFSSYGTRLRIDIKNSAFYDNYQAMPSHMGMARSLNDTLFISNCTFAGNSGGSATIAVQGTSVLTNNIFHNPAMNTQILIPNYISSGINSHTTLRYNNILGGMSGVYNATPANPLIWGDGNTDYDPMFTNEGNRPYTLSPGSPLIDSGWQASMAEPGYDAGGNERLWDGDGDGTPVIDKGAYEYQPVYSPVNLSAELWNSQLVLSWEMPVNAVNPSSITPSTSVTPATHVIPADAGIQPFTRGLSGYRVYRNSQPHADIQGADNTWFRERITQPDTLVYRVAALYGNVESALSDSLVVIVSSVEASDALAPSLPTLSVGPNPFTDLAVVRYTLPKAAKVELSIYNLRGQKVRTLDSGTKAAGEQILPWEGCDGRAQPLHSGVYLLRLSVDGKPARQMKAVLVK